jgi:hypothetical protein
MKKTITTITSLILLFSVNAQISTLGNTGIAANYVGWANTEAFPLQIRHNATGQPITFFTSNGTPTERMRLTPTGELGLGTTTPSSFMHLNTTTTGNLFRTNGPNNVTNQWQLFTNSQKFRVFVPANSNEANLEAVQAAGYLNLNTAGGTNTAYPNIKLRVFPDDIDRMVAFESPFISNATTFIPAYKSMLIKLCQIFFLGLIIKDIFDKWTQNLILSNSQRTWLPA